MKNSKVRIVICCAKIVKVPCRCIMKISRDEKHKKGGRAYQKEESQNGTLFRFIREKEY